MDTGFSDSALGFRVFVSARSNTLSEAEDLEAGELATSAWTRDARLSYYYARKKPVDVFVNATAMFDRLVLFTDDAIVVANPDKAALERLSATTSDRDWQSAIGNRVEIIAYASVTKVSTNKCGQTLSIWHGGPARDRLRTVIFKDAATRDDAWERLQRRLGRGFTLSDVQFGRLRAAVAPLVTIAFCLLFTWNLYWFATAIAVSGKAETRGRRAGIWRLMGSVLDALGPTGVVIVGGLATLIILAWGWARVRVPPRMLTLAR